MEELQGKIILFTGDSITDAGHLWEITDHFWGNGYVAVIGKTLPGEKVLNRGHDGATSGRMCRWWDSDCISNQPDVVTILVGINDLAEQLTAWKNTSGVQDYKKNLEWLIHETREKTDADVILMEPFLFPRPAEYLSWMKPLEEYRRTVRELAGKYRTGFVPLWDVFVDAQKKYDIDELTVDGIHLTRLGHEILADAWLMEYKRENRML